MAGTEESRTAAAGWRDAEKEFSRAWGQVLAISEQYTQASRDFNEHADAFADALAAFTKQEARLRHALEEAIRTRKQVEQAIAAWRKASGSGPSASAGKETT